MRRKRREHHEALQEDKLAGNIGYDALCRRWLTGSRWGREVGDLASHMLECVPKTSRWRPAGHECPRDDADFIATIDELAGNRHQRRQVATAVEGCEQYPRWHRG